MVDLSNFRGIGMDAAEQTQLIPWEPVLDDFRCRLDDVARLAGLELPFDDREIVEIFSLDIEGRKNEVLERLEPFGPLPGHAVYNRHCLVHYLDAVKSILIDSRNAPPRQPAPIFCQKRSGSAFISSVFCTAFGLPGGVISHKYETIVPSWLRFFATGKLVLHDHMEPSRANVDALFEAGMAPIVVHIRDPRAANASLAHLTAHDIGYGAPDNAMFTAMFDLWFDKTVAWIVEWKKLRDEHGDRIMLSRYEDMVKDVGGFFESVCGFLDIEGQVRKKILLEGKSLFENQDGANFRRGDPEGFRSELPQELLARMNEKLDDCPPESIAFALVNS